MNIHVPVTDSWRIEVDTQPWCAVDGAGVTPTAAAAWASFALRSGDALGPKRRFCSVCSPDSTPLLASRASCAMGGCRLSAFARALARVPARAGVKSVRLTGHLGPTRCQRSSALARRDTLPSLKHLRAPSPAPAFCPPALEATAIHGVLASCRLRGPPRGTPS